MCDLTIGEEVESKGGFGYWKSGRVLAVKPYPADDWRHRFNPNGHEVVVLVHGVGGRTFDCADVRRAGAIARLANLVTDDDG